MKATCETCRWFISANEASGNNFCCRFPPVPVVIGVTDDGKIHTHFSFAFVSGKNGCGEHQPRSKDDE